MNCHGNHDNGNNGNGHNNGHKGLSHMVLMALCCGAPAILLLMIPLISKIGGSGISNIFLGIAPFLCPLMMVFMLPMMFRGNKGNANRANSAYPRQEQPEERNLEK